MAKYAYVVTKKGNFWTIVNRKDRSSLGIGNFLTQDAAEKKAEERAKVRMGQGHTVFVYIEDEEGAERLRHKYEPPEDDL